MKVRLLSVASQEMAEALAWYRQRSPRAAEMFWLKLHDARRSIVLYPFAAPAISANARRFIVAGFPYDVIYAVLADEIEILAVAHHSRQPGYWKERLARIH